jgi:precorrin-2 dehydrogenase / sirohydrochlorin ferrochelatase
MGYLPILLDVTGRTCVVIGGGEIAERKAQSLLDAGAQVTIISLTATGAIARSVAAGRVTWIPRAFQPSDIAGAALVFAATDDSDLHAAVAIEAHRLGIPINVVDAPELCTFIAPAVAARGALQIAVSTSGAAPAFAARVRREIEEHFGLEYTAAVEILRAARIWMRTREDNQFERAKTMKALANSDLPAAVRRGDFEEIDRILAEVLGDAASLVALGFKRHSFEAAVASR